MFVFVFLTNEILNIVEKIGQINRNIKNTVQKLLGEKLFQNILKFTRTLTSSSRKLKVKFWTQHTHIYSIYCDINMKLPTKRLTSNILIAVKCSLTLIKSFAQTYFFQNNCICYLTTCEIVRNYAPFYLKSFP